MQEQKRLLITIVIATAFLYLWMTFFGPKPVKKPAVTETTTAATETQNVNTTAAAPATTETKKPAKPAAAPTIQSQNTPIWQTQWTTLAGVPSKILLQKYKQTDSTPVQVAPFISDGTTSLLWNFDVNGQAFSDDGEIYKEVSQEPRKLVYERMLTPEVRVRKTYSFPEDQYTFDLLVEVINTSATPKKIKAETEASVSFSSYKSPSMFHPGDPIHVTTFINDETHLFQPADIVKSKPIPTGDIRWAGVDSRYFLFSLIPVEAKWNELKTIPSWKDEALGAKTENLKQAQLKYGYPARDLAASSSQRYLVRVYAGPKDTDILSKVEPTLNRSIDFGNWLGHIARPIHKLLTTIYDFIPNYGIAIILLTALVRLLMFPLAQMQAKSMKKMQEHKPQMDAIREKNKDNKEGQSRELMNYMKQHRINPMGGCLLLLPQLPIFFSLYRVIYNSIELRQAPFFGWIHDLSVHDPYFILPVILGGVMFFQQKITPSPGLDPAQATMMKVMPVMFTFFMLFLPAGLNLYILVSTAWGIGQQLWVQGYKGNTQTNILMKQKEKQKF